MFCDIDNEEEQVGKRQDIKWYQCKRDITITVIILMIFGIAILNFDIYENFRLLWVALKAKTGFSSDMFFNLFTLIDLFFEWGMWLPTLAVFIASIVVCLKHYWAWTTITLLGVSVHLTLYSSNDLGRTMQFIDVLRYEFGSISSFIGFLEGVWTFALLSSLYSVLVSFIILRIRRKKK